MTNADSPLRRSLNEMQFTHGDSSHSSDSDRRSLSIAQMQGEGAYPVQRIQEDLALLVSEVNAECLLTSSFDGLPGNNPIQETSLPLSEEVSTSGRTAPHLFYLEEEETSSEEPNSMGLADFQQLLEETYPSLFDVLSKDNREILLTNMSERLYGSINISALEALGKQCVRSHVGREKNKVVYWADLLNPSPDTLSRIERAFGLHPLTTEDVSVLSTREKVEEYPRYLYIVFSERQFKPNSNNVRLANVNILLFRNFVLSIHKYPITSFPIVLYHAIHRSEVVQTAEWVAYRLMDSIVDDLMLKVEAVGTEVRQIGSFILQMVGSDSQEDFILRISVSRQQIAELSEQLVYKRDVLVHLSAEKQNLLQPFIKLYLRDILDHVVLMLQQLQHSEDVLNNANATYLALISIAMSQGSHQMNKVMKKFSAMTTIVLPLTLVSSIWGMNVEVPGATWGLGLLWFFLIIICMCSWTCVATIFFKCKKWL